MLVGSGVPALQTSLSSSSSSRRFGERRRFTPRRSGAASGLALESAPPPRLLCGLSLGLVGIQAVSPARNDPSPRLSSRARVATKAGWSRSLRARFGSPNDMTFTATRRVCSSGRGVSSLGLASAALQVGDEVDGPVGGGVHADKTSSLCFVLCSGPGRTVVPCDSNISTAGVQDFFDEAADSASSAVSCVQRSTAFRMACTRWSPLTQAKEVFSAPATAFVRLLSSMAMRNINGSM
mmetsp:Transcript_22674/g.43336  ORF Transcript_22674/g.43336 Transcript_22674/m.43336 type:complete len:237 (-) Transcript_22674:478-1188(-)